MMRLLSLYVLFLVFNSSYAQKPSLTNDTDKSWNALLDYDISNNGKFIWYSHGSMTHGVSAIIKSIDGKFTSRGTCLFGQPKFTADSKYAVYLSCDTLNILNLTNNKSRTVLKVTSFSVPTAANGKWLSYYSEGNLFLQNLSTGAVQKFAGAKSSMFNQQGSALLIKGDSSLDWLNMSTLKTTRLINEASIANMDFDATGDIVVFSPIINNIKRIYFYKKGMSTAEEIVGPNKGLKDGSELSFRTPAFSKDSKTIFFWMTVPINNSAPEDFYPKNVITPKLTLWHYKDEYMQTYRRNLNRRKQVEVIAAVRIENKNVVMLERPDTTSIEGGQAPGNEFIITGNRGNSTEVNWNDNFKKYYELVSIKDGSTKRVCQDMPIYTHAPKISPNSGFLSWYDHVKKNHFTYEIKTGIVRNITSNIPTSFTPEADESTADGAGGSFSNFWMANDKALLICDRYDIWQVDPYAKKAPINITGGLGRKNKIIFRLAANEYAFPPPVYNETLLIAAMSEINKKNGLFKIVAGKENIPDIGSMGHEIYYFPWKFMERMKDIKKAKGSDVYVLQHMTSTSAPNVHVTSDFKKFTALSDIQPQKEYNWMTTELVKWRQKDGKEIHGLLYKPENFDPAKKYPTIFHYYDRSSHKLNLFELPEMTVGMNLAWYVSNGYIVFVPDIYSPPGHPAKGVIESVTAAVEKLKEFPWIDQSKMGIQGHSFGGYETFVLLANTNLFAAAQPSSGLSNLITGYTSLGGTSAFLYEKGQTNIRTTPWQNPALYMENSPYFKTGSVTTPVLIMHNKEDGAVDFIQSLEMFVALRREKKPVWLLEYEGEGHHIDDPNNLLDYTIRQQQFFAHYLKGAPAPRWMKEPIPSHLRELESGLATD